MDNLTHSLIGAALGQAGLKRKTGLAMPTLILAANLPDLDAYCTVYGIESLSMRRGITHGPVALTLLPLLLAGAIFAFDRWQAGRGKRPAGRLPVHLGWLIVLAYIGTLSHPLFDWFNNYGIRLMEPLSHQWFYGDTLFIIDIWLLLLLGGGVWLSLRRERRGVGTWPKPAIAALSAAGIYVLGNAVISQQAEAGALQQLRAREDPTASMPDPLVVANAVPLAFWQREILWRDGSAYGRGAYQLGSGVVLEPGEKPHNMADPRIAEWIKSDPAARAFLFWSRMQVAEPQGEAILLRDQRFSHPLTARNFTVRLTAPDTASHPE